MIDVCLLVPSQTHYDISGRPVLNTRLGRRFVQSRTAVLCLLGVFFFLHTLAPRLLDWRIETVEKPDPVPGELISSSESEEEEILSHETTADPTKRKETITQFSFIDFPQTFYVLTVLFGIFLVLHITHTGLLVFSFFNPSVLLITLCYCRSVTVGLLEHYYMGRSLRNAALVNIPTVAILILMVGTFDAWISLRRRVKVPVITCVTVWHMFAFWQCIRDPKRARVNPNWEVKIKLQI